MRVVFSKNIPTHVHLLIFSVKFFVHMIHLLLNTKGIKYMIFYDFPSVITEGRKLELEVADDGVPTLTRVQHTAAQAYPS